MKNIFIYTELEDGIVADVSLELFSKGKKLAEELGVKLGAIVVGANLNGIEKQIYPYGVDIIYTAEDKRLEVYQNMPHAEIVSVILKEYQPQI
ncbi:MAG: electron transfer flavoprotein subunit alpha, partial [Bacteroidales bacterium]|nr:electron transfer flavoprotein subunit alpha [Bacteroidales bacterium]